MEASRTKHEKAEGQQPASQVETLSRTVLKLLEDTRLENERLKKRVHSLEGRIGRLVISKGRKDLEEEEIDLFSTLPPEILETILLNYVKDCKDIFNTTLASLSCADVLRPTQGTWMFHKTIPFFLKYINRKDMLNLRLVCKIWRSSVDNHLENIAMTGKFISWQFWPRTSHTVSEFMESMSNYDGGYPFVGKRITFSKTSLEIDEHYWTHVMLLLKQYGVEINECRFLLDDTPVNFMFILRGCLQRLPNLKRLEIQNLEYDKVGSFRRLHLLKRNLEQNPFPELVHLNHIDLLSVPLLFYQYALPKYSRQLKILNLRPSLYSDSEINLDFSKLPNIEIVRLPVGSNQDLKRFFLPVKPFLTELTLDISSANKEVLIQDVILLLHHLESSLRFLEIYEPEFVILPKGEWTTPFLNQSILLPRLRTLKLNDPSLITLHLLVYFHSIHTLDIKWKLTTDQLMTLSSFDLEDFESKSPHGKYLQFQNVKLFGYAERMYESNIWKLLPHLKTCRLSASNLYCRDPMFKHFYTRDMYEHVNQEKQ